MENYTIITKEDLRDIMQVVTHLIQLRTGTVSCTLDSEVAEFIDNDPRAKILRQLEIRLRAQRKFDQLMKVLCELWDEGKKLKAIQILAATGMTNHQARIMLEQNFAHA